MTEPVKRRRKVMKESHASHQTDLLEEAVLAFGRAWIGVQETTAAKNLTQTRAIELLKKLKLGKFTAEASGEDTTGSISVTLVEGERLVIDYDKLKRKVGSTVWQKITKRVPDQTLIDQAIKDGLMSLTDVAECADTVPNAAYLKVKASGVL